MSILSKLLQKRGIKDVSELDKEEQKTFAEWQRVLSKDDISLKDVESFCSMQVLNIEAQFKDLNTSKEKIERLVLLHSVYSSLKNLINSPRQERESLEKYLTQLL